MEKLFVPTGFDPALLPADVRSFDAGVNLFNRPMLNGHCMAVPALDFQKHLKELWKIASEEAQEFKLNEDMERFQNLCAWMIKHGFVLVDIIVPAMVDRKKAGIALNMIEDFQDYCWCYSSKHVDVGVLRGLIKSAYTRCKIEKESNMITDLQLPHKGAFKAAKYERLRRAIRADQDNWRFERFFAEFAKHVARKPEDLDLLLDKEDGVFSGGILRPTIDCLNDAGKTQLVNDILKDGTKYELYKAA